MRMNRIIITVVLAMACSAMAQEPYCYPDHWSDELCRNGATPLLPKYFSCYTQPTPGEDRCCKYETQNHSCVLPPPAIAKFFRYQGYYPGKCHSNSAGQWCDDMPPVQEPGGPG